MPRASSREDMLAISGNAQIYIFNKAVNMRNGFDGLSAIIERSMVGEPTSGAFYVFLNRQRNRMKVLYWDTDGFAIWYKRLEKGRFPMKDSGRISMTRKEFFMLLEGVIPKRITTRFSLEKT